MLVDAELVGVSVSIVDPEPDGLALNVNMLLSLGIDETEEDLVGVVVMRELEEEVGNAVLLICDGSDDADLDIVDVLDTLADAELLEERVPVLEDDSVLLDVPEPDELRVIIGLNVPRDERVIETDVVGLRVVNPLVVWLRVT
jgi:hypothetical protein